MLIAPASQFSDLSNDGYSTYVKKRLVVTDRPIKMTAASSSFVAHVARF
jgi:hypothetical protein